jgi:hypothetical protein
VDPARDLHQQSQSSQEDAEAGGGDAARDRHDGARVSRSAARRKSPKTTAGAESRLTEPVHAQPDAGA